MTTAPAKSGSGMKHMLGLPDVRGNARLVAANVIDSLGNGLVLAFTVVFFVRTTGLPLAEIGVALTTGQLLSLPVPALTGPLLDRFGARTVVVAGNLVSAVGFLGFLVAREAWLIVIVQMIVQSGANVFWTSSRSLVLLAAAGTDRQRWFALISSLRNIGTGFGAAVAALSLQFVGTAGLRAVVFANAVTFLLVAWLIATWRPSGEARRAAFAAVTAGSTAGGYRDVLRDGQYLRLVTVNLGFVFAAMVLPVLLAVYATGTLHVEAWFVGVLVVINTVVVAVTQTSVTRWNERRPVRVIAVGAVLNVLAFVLFAAVSGTPVWAVYGGLVAAMLVYTLAEMLSGPPMNELSVSISQLHIQGRYQAAFQLSWSLGGAASPAVLTALLARGPLWPWVFLAGVNLLSVLLVRRVVPRPETLKAGHEH